MKKLIRKLLGFEPRQRRRDRAADRAWADLKRGYGKRAGRSEWDAYAGLAGCRLDEILGNRY